MPGSNKPKHPNSPEIAFGILVARLRSQRGLSRAGLVKLLDDKLDETGLVFDDTVSEGWVRKIEEGRKVKLPRIVIELLADALGCSPEERFALLLSADRNPISDTDGSTGASQEFLLRAISAVNGNPRTRHLLDKLVGDNRDKVTKMTEQELFMILRQILDIVK